MIINRSDSLIYYPFEGNVNDFSGNSNNGTVNGTDTYVDSISGKAFDFDGSTQIDTGVSSMGTGSFSILLRGSFDMFTSNRRFISKQQPGDSGGWLLFYNNAVGQLRLSVYLSGAYVTCDVSVSSSTIYAVYAYFDSANEIGLQVYQTDGTLTTNTTSTAVASYTDAGRNIAIGS